MKITCSECGYLINRDKIVEGQMVEEYENIYGTSCPKCGTINKPTQQPGFVQQRFGELELLRETAREILRRKINGH